MTFYLLNNTYNIGTEQILSLPSCHPYAQAATDVGGNNWDLLIFHFSSILKAERDLNLTCRAILQDEPKMGNAYLLTLR